MLPPQPKQLGSRHKERSMATRASRKKSKDPQHSGTEYRHPLRIVPLHSAPRILSTSHPQLTYRNGPLLTNVEVFTLFWGSAWQTAANSPLMTHMNDFFDYVLTSKLLDQLAEYNVPGKSIGHGSRTGTTVLASSEPGKTVTDAAIQKMLQDEISAGSLPTNNSNSLYFVFLPPGTQVDQGGAKSCQTFCGYHDATTDNIFYAVMPYPGCTGCEGGLAIPDALTSTSSHELCEAITDPVPGTGWYDDANGEIGDICAWRTKTLGSYAVQLEWSNSADACV
jgi:hypothetical protein